MADGPIEIFPGDTVANTPMAEDAAAEVAEADHPMRDSPVVVPTEKKSRYV